MKNGRSSPIAPSGNGDWRLVPQVGRRIAPQLSRYAGARKEILTPKAADGCPVECKFRRRTRFDRSPEAAGRRTARLTVLRQIERAESLFEERDDGPLITQRESYLYTPFGRSMVGEGCERIPQSH